MISPTIGGGVGRLQGLHGMISDQLLSARMVIANGSIVSVSQAENPDLFWAVRGAGGNFGILVEATYQLTNLTSKYVINMDYAFKSNASAAIVDYLSSFGETPPAKLSFMIAGLYDEDQFGGVSRFGDFSLTARGRLTRCLMLITSELLVQPYCQRNLQRPSRRGRVLSCSAPQDCNPIQAKRQLRAPK